MFAGKDSYEVLPFISCRKVSGKLVVKMDHFSFFYFLIREKALLFFGFYFFIIFIFWYH